MATETRRVLRNSTVTVCDRCGKHKNKMFKATLRLNPGPGMGEPMEFEGDLCDSCATMLYRRTFKPAKRTRKAVADAE